MVKINWTPLSLSDLKSVFDYIAEDSFRYAQITVNKIYFHVSELEKQPLIGRIVPEFDDWSIRELISGNYRIVYELVNKSQIDILRIFHTARKLDKDRLNR
ncbi:MAG: type II toxin-antitoxin system RelE/ParE family toxin [Bacteroidales bacterium]|nr:type II toxin-antitoxin system RelE/ParE family toxin [Bacteroidales bacterium]MDT8430989.1 type II toxin-antitoxin system RelE/ParE family toxin [Bacteroidales bacterium]